MTQRRGDYIQTFSGRAFWCLDPRPEDVCIEDIAHALALQNRYAGHSLVPLSVAEHSWHVSHHVPPEHALWGLLHDAAEAYSADIPRPLKRFLTEWAPIEARIMEAVCMRFGLPLQEPPEVKQVDLAMTTDEYCAIMAASDLQWKLPYASVGAVIQCWDWQTSESMFIERFNELADERKIAA